MWAFFIAACAGHHFIVVQHQVKNGAGVKNFLQLSQFRE